MSEFDLQCFVVQLLERTAAPDVLWYAIPNGENRNAITGARLKRMGTRRGAADLAFVLPEAGRAAFLELKSAKGRLSAFQKAFQLQAIAAGARYAVASSPEEATAILTSWGAIAADKGRVA